MLDSTIDFGQHTRNMKYDMAGKKFGRLTVIEPLGDPDKIHTKWRCICECGNTVTPRCDGLRAGNSKSCGCMQKEAAAASGRASRTHGKSHSPEYNSWHSMKSRCYNPNETGYHHYGGRGITVCDRWLNSLDDFIADMGPRPKGTTVGRINNDGNYEPSNCRWETWPEQARNKRNITLIEYQGEMLTGTELAKHLGLPQHVVAKRLRCGWTLERIVSTPLIQSASHPQKNHIDIPK